jgi:hypothetical protein
MSTWYNYNAVTPVIEHYVDDGSRDLCLGRIEIGNVGVFEVAVVGQPTSIELIRVATLDSDGNLTEEQSWNDVLALRKKPASGRRRPARRIAA